MPVERRKTSPDRDEPIQGSGVPCGKQHGPRLLRFRGPPRAGLSVERGILQEDPRLELLQCGHGLEPERVYQRGATLAEHLERLGLSAGAVERQHQLAAQALVQRMLRHDLLELRDEHRAAAELELGVEALLQHRQTQTAQALDDRHRERLEREIRERLAPPDRERFPVELDGRLRVATAERRSRSIREPLEVLEVERIRRHQDPVAGWSRLDHRVLQQAA